jgi:hypothetical protein
VSGQPVGGARSDGKGLSNELILGLSVALIGLAGVLAGSLVSYFANKSLQQGEIEYAKVSELRTARSAAALEHLRLSNLARQLSSGVEAKLTVPLPPRLTRSRLATTELAVMILHLDTQESRAYSDTEVCAESAEQLMERVVNRKRTDGSLRLENFIVRQFAQEQHCIEQGAQALRSLARK